MDSQVCCMDQALQRGNVELLQQIAKEQKKDPLKHTLVL